MPRALWFLIAGLHIALKAAYARPEKWDTKLLKACEEWLAANAQYNPDNR